MTKSLSERIYQREKYRPKSLSKIRDKNRIAFLAIQEEVSDALDVGWSMKAIWNTLHEEGKIEMTYETFTVYVRRYIRDGDGDVDGASGCGTE